MMRAKAQLIYSHLSLTARHASHRYFTSQSASSRPLSSHGGHHPRGGYSRFVARIVGRIQHQPGGRGRRRQCWVGLPVFPNKAAIVVALIDRDHAKLADALEALLDGPAQGSLRETLDDVALLLIDQQYGDPVYAAAIDHEERRLPLGARAHQADRRFAVITQTLIARHRGEISATLPDSAPQDLLLIARAIVETDSGMGQVPPEDLRSRIARALLGYLVAP